MLTLYYNRFSLYSRPVWLALLEKNLSFDLVSLQLNGDQFEAEFLAINPFSRIPVLIDDDLQIVESSAILDYLEAKYPTPALLPTQAKELAKVRMVQAITINELLPAAVGLIIHLKNPLELEYARQRAINVLNFFEDLLQELPYFAGQFTIAEIVAGTLVPDLPKLGISLELYPRLDRWSQYLLSRESWQTTQANPEEFDNFQRRLRVLVKIWQKRRRQRTAIFAQRNLQHNP
ncbi:MAG: glutathione S-transferase family protein [Hydrococcus sp. Prado102]|jgi:glutathione S-transferase|nr:glutathione S-transferase family protein [Hydrococcus sp. Prado102]